MTDTKTLLADYVRTGSESAFRELVARYMDLVYSTALRSVGGTPHLAEDVAQLVFLQLARKAGTISGRAMLGGWLHRVSVNEASKLVRTENRRRTRERQALQMR